MNTATVIATYNNEATIEKCLQGLKSNGITNVVLVDNNSADSTLSLVPPEAYLIKNNINKGFATAANQGAQYFSAQADVPDYYFFINPDAFLIEPDLIKRAETYLDNHKRVGIVGLLLCDLAGKPESQGFGDEVDLSTLVSRHFSTKQTLTAPKQVGWVSGGAMIVRRSTWEQLGGFDPKFFMYWEDVDLCRRANKAGSEVVILPDLRVLHQRGASLADSRQRHVLYNQSADIYFRKHYPKPIWLTQKLLRRIYRWSAPQAS